MPKQQSGVVTRGIGFELERLRRAASLTLQDVGDGLGVSASTISRLENGKREPTAEEVASILAIVGVVGAERVRLLDQARGGSGLGLVEVSTPTIQSRTYLNFETRATTITDVEPLLVPGLAQSPDYARAIISGTLVSDDDADIEARVARRMARQVILTRRNPPQLNLIITETALRLPLGGAKAMARQVRYLLDLAERPNVSFHVLPVSLLAHPALDGSFVLLDFGDDPSIVFIEDRTTGLFLDDKRKVGVYRLTVEKLTDMALDAQGSIQLMASIAHDLDRE
ncbi:MAG TPA: helix-turn-helix transcriptional regulator [Umezawaea sp.]|nr:helix-turn-helix transcriptional regulator [Umezawaea sp.]